MGSRSISDETKPHAVLVPYPAQGHINPMTHLAKLLHSKGFHITYVNTEFNHKRLLRSRGTHALHALPHFRFETIPDGLPPSDLDAGQDPTSISYSTSNNCVAPLVELMSKLKQSASAPPITCVVHDGIASFAAKAANILGIPSVLFWTASSCGLVGYCQYPYLLHNATFPLKDESDVTNGYLETKLECIPGIHNFRLRDLPSFIRTTDPQHIMLNFVVGEIEAAHRASIIVINTFHDFEKSSLDYLSSLLPAHIYTIGPLHLLLRQINNTTTLSSIASNLWKEDSSVLHWLNSQSPASVLYVNYGSVTTMSSAQLAEFAWGLATTKRPFLWVIRPDLVEGGASMSTVLSSDSEFKKQIEGRGMITTWCPQEEVLNHPAVGGFLTHCGWNSTLESVCAGKPMLCWPFFAEQPTNCRYACVEWGIGMEVAPVVEREEVRRLVLELMEGENRGKEMREKVLEWKNKAEEATNPTGSSYQNMERMIEAMLNIKPPV
ncbi:7-deoxyloganetin glucosyltransferase-like [Senna tora]|uniref:Glycosyltransferase n=1 Tax=Senna tora TaxID=362788 RepID=A0A834SFZ9_9FABA|nr:7-deoxyloganetin glucosyltransferase-like [Senna tora]